MRFFIREAVRLSSIPPSLLRERAPPFDPAFTSVLLFISGPRFLADFWSANHLTPAEGRHGECGKGEGPTNHVECSFNTLRRRFSRFVRKVFSLSKDVQNHVGPLGFFIRPYKAFRI